MTQNTSPPDLAGPAPELCADCGTPVVLTGERLRHVEILHNHEPILDPDQAERLRAAALAGTGLVVPSGQAAELDCQTHDGRCDPGQAAELADHADRADRTQYAQADGVSATEAERLDRIDALSPGDARMLLHYMAGWAPDGVDHGLAMLAEQAAMRAARRGGAR